MDLLEQSIQNTESYLEHHPRRDEENSRYNEYEEEPYPTQEYEEEAYPSQQFEYQYEEEDDDDDDDVENMYQRRHSSVG